MLHLPRRELYDVRVQLLGEADEHSDVVVDQLDKSDIRSGVYEGGFKTWECSVDLASLLLDRGPRKDLDELFRCDQIIEVGYEVVSLRVNILKVSIAWMRHCSADSCALPARSQEQHPTQLRSC